MSLTIGNKNVTVASSGHSAELELPAGKNLTTIISSTSSKCYNLTQRTCTSRLILEEKQWFNLIVSGRGNQIIAHKVKQNVTLPPPGKAKLCTVLLPLSDDDKTFDIFLDKDRIQENVVVMGVSNCTVVGADHCKLTVKGKNSSTTYISSDIVVQNGGIYTAVMQKTRKGVAKVTLYEDLQAKSVSMLYQIPQYFVITSGEIMFSITGELPISNVTHFKLLIIKQNVNQFKVKS